MKCAGCERVISRDEDRWLYDSSGRLLDPVDALCEECFGSMVNTDRAEMLGTFVHVQAPSNGTQICDNCGKVLQLARLQLYAQRTHERVPASRASTLIVQAINTRENYTGEHLEQQEYAICTVCDRLLTSADILAWSK